VTTFTAGQQQTLPLWILTNLSRPNQLPIVNVVGVDRDPAVRVPRLPRASADRCRSLRRDYVWVSASVKVREAMTEKRADDDAGSSLRDAPGSWPSTTWARRGHATRGARPRDHHGARLCARSARRGPRSGDGQGPPDRRGPRSPTASGASRRQRTRWRGAASATSSSSTSGEVEGIISMRDIIHVWAAAPGRGAKGSDPWTTTAPPHGDGTGLTPSRTTTRPRGQTPRPRLAPPHGDGYGSDPSRNNRTAKGSGPLDHASATATVTVRV
jgi:hypothetical protein